MNFNRSIILVCMLAIAICEEEEPPTDDSLLPARRSLLFFPPIFGVPKPPAANYKPFSIFSKPPPDKEGDDPHKGQADQGGSIASHVGNVLHGGSIRFEIRPLAPLQGILDHAKKFIPGGRGTVGRPSHDRPNEDRPNYDRPHHEQPNEDKPHYERPHEERPNYDRPPHERPNYPSHERPPHHEQPNKEHFERPHRPGYHRPNTDHPRPVPQPPKKDEEDEWETNKKDPHTGPQWEDIGEVDSTGEDDYGEGVLQPRRPKRFVESRIYHVPLLFRSNGRADRVRIKGRNGLREKTREI